ncbi:MAG: MerR family transcriptional regulator [Clostridia bacterium]|nr:MerR family transcriptional regulator [Clostridia bacterium]
MYQKQMYDITEVCKMLGTTSRTLRFYEEKGIIQSTTVGTSSRRQYTEEQISHIKNVLVLRTLGLSVKAVAELQTKEVDLKDSVLSKRAEIYASIDSRIREINLLNEALSALESGKDIFAEDWQLSSAMNAEEKEIARICTDAILSGDTDTLYEYLSSRLAEYMPRDVYRVVRKDTLAPLGDFVSIDKTVADDRFSNKLYCFIRYSKLGLKITYVFYGGRIDGFWLGYYDLNAR